MVSATRKVAANEKTAAAAPVLIGTYVPGATLGQVQGRGRRAEPLPAELVSQLQQMLKNGGAAEAHGTAAQVDKLKRQITRFVDERTEGGQPTDKGFRTLSKDDKGRQTGIRYSVFSVEVTDSK